MRTEFDHDRLRVFQLAVDCYEACVQLTVRVPSLHWHLVTQLLRACASVALNIAEGAAEFSPAERSDSIGWRSVRLRNAERC